MFLPGSSVANYNFHPILDTWASLPVGPLWVQGCTAEMKGFSNIAAGIPSAGLEFRFQHERNANSEIAFTKSPRCTSQKKGACRARLRKEAGERYRLILGANGRSNRVHGRSTETASSTPMRRTHGALARHLDPITHGGERGG